MCRNPSNGENGEYGEKLREGGGIKEFPLRVAILAKNLLDKKFLVFSLKRWQRGSLKVAILTEIASLAKMAYS